MELIVHGNADSLPAFAHTECTGKFNLIRNVIFGDELSESFDNIV